MRKSFLFTIFEYIVQIWNYSRIISFLICRYSWEQNRSWRFEHSFFYPDPLRGDFNIGGLNFQWGEEGIFGMGLSPIRSDGFRTLYFSPLASHREFSVSTRVLRDESRVDNSYHDFFFYPTERASNSHTTSRVVSDDGVMLFNLIDQNAVGCWHTTTPYTPTYHGVVDRDDEGLIFPADVKIDENRNVWVLSDRMANFLISSLDYNDVNFRIYSAPLQTLISGTPCDLSTRITSRFGLNSILSQKPIGSNIFTNTLGLGAFKSLNTNPLISSSQNLQNPQSLQNLQSRQSLQNLQTLTQPLNAQALQVPLQPIGQVSQIAQIPQISQVPPLVSYDVREPQINSFTNKPLGSAYTTKATPQNTYFQGKIFGTTQSQSSADFSTAIQNLPKNQFNNQLATPSWWTTQLW